MKNLFYFLAVCFICNFSYADNIFSIENGTWRLKIGEKKLCLPQEYEVEFVSNSYVGFVSSTELGNRISVFWGLTSDDVYNTNFKSSYTITKSGSLGQYTYSKLTINKQYPFELFSILLELPDVGVMQISSPNDVVLARAKNITSTDYCIQ